MSNLSVSDASALTLLQELILRTDDEGDSVFRLNTLPMYISLDKKQEPTAGTQVPPIPTPSSEEE